MAYIRNISGTYMNYIGNIYEIGYMGRLLSVFHHSRAIYVILCDKVVFLLPQNREHSRRLFLPKVNRINKQRRS